MNIPKIKITQCLILSFVETIHTILICHCATSGGPPHHSNVCEGMEEQSGRQACRRVTRSHLASSIVRLLPQPVFFVCKSKW